MLEGPFALQELIDYCLDFLHASGPDLKRCALVSRHWTNTCQKHLFSHIIIGSPGYSYEDSTFLAIRRRCHLRCEVLSTSPRLLGLVKSLQTHLDAIPPETLISFAKLSFPSLRRIIVSGTWIPASATKGFSASARCPPSRCPETLGLYRDSFAFSRAAPRASRMFLSTTSGSIDVSIAFPHRYSIHLIERLKSTPWTSGGPPTSTIG
ncbi:hypothetical protein DFH08DRAFT_95993 [Mycena albidolilacea]|uniref:F-box domain-containing protein n=1 Tax=Mycena albidolilacea TaxID=1033008 RepID=A0AAD7E7K6_9AGAR|nr:hypothetical protein DFH08DRAFT_95993 [Mycena albidolilacea]